MKEYESSWGKSASRGPFYVTGKLLRNVSAKVYI